MLSARFEVTQPLPSSSQEQPLLVTDRLPKSYVDTIELLLYPSYRPQAPHPAGREVLRQQYAGTVNPGHGFGRGVSHKSGTNATERAACIGKSA